MLFYTILIRLLCPVEIGIFSIEMKSELVNNVQQDNYLYEIILFIWIIGMIVKMIIHFHKINLMNKMYNSLIHSSLSVKEKFNDYIVVKSPLITSAMVIGLHKEIFLPTFPYSEEEKQYILLHESKHIELKDMWLKCIILFLSIVYWWFPPIYYFKKISNIFFEIRVDKKVLENKKHEDGLSYMETLLSVAKKQNQLAQEEIYLMNTFTSNLIYRANYFFHGKKKRTNIVVLLLTFFVPFSICFSNMKTIDKTPDKNTITHKYDFNGLKDTDKIVQLPGGGWLYGEADVYSGPWYNRKKTTYSSFTDKNAITISEYKEK